MEENPIIKENLETEYFTNDIPDTSYKIVVFRDRIYKFSTDDERQDYKSLNSLANQLISYYPKIEQYIGEVDNVDDLILYINDLPYVITGDVQDNIFYVDYNSFFDSRNSGELNKIAKSGMFDKIVFDGKTIYSKERNKDKTLPSSKAYHGTIVSFALGIIQKGLRPNPSNSTFKGIVHNDTVFLSTIYETAQSYATRAYEKYRNNTIESEPAVIEFDLNRMDSNKIVFDYDFHNWYTNRTDSVYNKVANNFYDGMENPEAVANDNANPLKFGKIGYRGIVMPSAISKIILPLRNKSFKDVNSFIAYIQKENSNNQPNNNNITTESINEGSHYIQNWQREIINSLPDKVTLYHSTSPEAMEYILGDGEIKHGLGNDGDSNNIWFSLNAQNDFGSCLFAIEVPKSDFENGTFKLMNDAHVCYKDFSDLSLEQYPYIILKYKGYKIPDLVKNAGGDYDKFVDILYILLDKQDDYVMIHNLMDEFINGKYGKTSWSESVKKNNNGKIFYITEDQAKTILTENRESKNINLARKYVISKGYDANTAQKIIDGIRTDIPNSRIGQCKFLLGVTRMYLNGELNDQNNIAKLNKTLVYVGSETHINEYDNNLNNLHASDLIHQFSVNVENDLAQDKENISNQSYQVNNDYTIVPINSFEEAEQYGNYTTWCVTHQESMYNSYTHDGLGKFYFCLKNGFENIPEQVGENCPLDEYGLSMIAVSVNEDGSLNTCTCRWNHSNGGNDNIMTTQQISQLLGVNFYQTFLPVTEEEKNAAIERINEKYYDALEYLNNYDDFDSFVYYEEMADDLYVVSMSDEGDVALITNDGGQDEWYFYPYNEDGIITFFKDCNLVNNSFTTLTERNGKSYLINPDTRQVIYNLPDNTRCESLDYTLSDSHKYVVRFFESYENFRILDLKTNVTSEKEYSRRNTRISGTTKKNILFITQTVYSETEKRINTTYEGYYDITTGKEIDGEEQQVTFKVFKKIRGSNERFDIVIDKRNLYNLFDNVFGRLCFEIWFKNMSQLWQNDNLILVELEDNSYNFINLSDSVRDLMFNENLKTYQIMNNGKSLIAITQSNDVYEVDLDSLHAKMLNQEQIPQMESIIRENFELEVTPDEIDTSTVDKKDRLNNKIWLSNGKLNPKVRLKLLDIADEFWFSLGLEWVEVKDIIITGSICNYNWNDYSDIDLHILVDYRDIDENVELVKEFCDSVKNEWNENHLNLSIYGFPVELYIQDINEKHDSTGIYSLEKDGWIKEPSKDNIQPIDGRADEIKEKSAMLMTIVDNMETEIMLHKDDAYRMGQMAKKVNSFINRLRKMRKKSLDAEGEMSSGNLVYKLMRQKGYIDKIYKLKYIVFDYLNSLN